jgi:hypothetical protein
VTLDRLATVATAPCANASETLDSPGSRLVAAVICDDGLIALGGHVDVPAVGADGDGDGAVEGDAPGAGAAGAVVADAGGQASKLADWSCPG